MSALCHCPPSSSSTFENGNDPLHFANSNSLSTTSTVTLDPNTTPDAQDPPLIDILELQAII